MLTNFLVLALLSANIARAQELTPADKERAMQYLEIEKAMKGGPPEPRRDLKKIDDGVVAMIPDRSHKAQAPDALKPTNRFASPEGSLKHFLESRAQTEGFLNNTPDFRQHVTDSPLGMKLDAYEWVIFLTAHSERHLKQIQEVKSDPNFPKA
jgi:DinB superfamily